MERPPLPPLEFVGGRARLVGVVENVRVDGWEVVWRRCLGREAREPLCGRRVRRRGVRREVMVVCCSGIMGGVVFAVGIGKRLELEINFDLSSRDCGHVSRVSWENQRCMHRSGLRRINASLLHYVVLPNSSHRSHCAFSFPHTV